MFKSIKTRLIFIVFLIVMLSISGVSFIVYKQNIKKIESLLGQQVESIAKTGATLIDGDEHQKIVDNIAQAGSLPEWKKLQQALARIKEKNNLQEDVYTMMDAYWIPPDKEHPHGQVLFTAMAKNKNFEPKGQKKENYINSSMQDKVAGHTDIFQTVNGFFITGYAPILTSKGAVTAVLEVALEVGKEIKQARLSLIKGILIAAVIALAFATILTVFASQKISSPIKALTSVVLKMSSGDLQARVGKINTGDEIAILGDGFNEMASNLEKSYRELEKYSEHLEEMVAERTAELAAANRKITVMLNSMKLGVFAVDSEYKIQSPVSDFSKEIFKKTVDEENVLDVVYKDLDKNDPVRSGLESALISIYGEDEFQWELMEDQFPTRLELKSVDSDDVQYLEIKYSPLWDEDENLYQLLYVIDDVTELKRLENEARKAREESALTNLVLTELSNLDISSMEQHFLNFKDLFEKCSGNIESWANVKELYMDLHTIKGNSRVLGLSLIADAVHHLESEFADFKSKDSLSEKEKDNFSDRLLEVQVVVGRYNTLANRIFKVKNYFNFPDVTKYFYFMIDFLNEGTTSDSIVKELHENIDNSTPKELESLENVNWSHIFNRNLENVINFNEFNPFLVNNNDMKLFFEIVKDYERGEIVEDKVQIVRRVIQGASYFFDCLFDENLTKKDYRELILKDLKKLATLSIYVDFFIKSNGAFRLQLNNAAEKGDWDSLIGPLKNVYDTFLNFESRSNINVSDYTSFLDLELMQTLAVMDKKELIENVDSISLNWEEKSKQVILNGDDQNLILENIKATNDIEELPAYYSSLRSIFIKGLLSQVSRPLRYYSSVETVEVNKHVFDELKSWIGAANKLKEGEILLSEAERYPLGDFVKDYASYLEVKGLEQDKEVKVLIDEDSDLISSTEYTKIKDCVGHLLTNALAHGIETSEERIKNGKKPIGEILLGAKRSESGHLKIYICDDGAGLDFDEMKKAISRNESINVADVESLSESEVFDIFLKNSISTKDDVDLLSGRGEGLSTIGRLRETGEIDVRFESEKNKGTKFIFEFSKV